VLNISLQWSSSFMKLDHLVSQNGWSGFKKFVIWLNKAYYTVRGVTEGGLGGLKPPPLGRKLILWGFQNGMTLENWTIGSKVRYFWKLILEMVKNDWNTSCTRFKVSISIYLQVFIQSKLKSLTVLEFGQHKNDAKFIFVIALLLYDLCHSIFFHY